MITDLPSSLEVPRDLADRGRLAGAVDADTRITVGSVRTSMRSPRRGGLGEQLRSRSRQLLPARELTRPASFSSARPPSPSSRAHVGVDQRLLEPLPGLVVERPEDGRLQLRPERLPRLRHVLAQPPEERRRASRSARLGRAAGGRRAVMKSSRQVRAMAAEDSQRGAQPPLGRALRTADLARPRRRETTFETPSLPMLTP